MHLKHSVSYIVLLVLISRKKSEQNKLGDSLIRNNFNKESLP